MEHVCLSTTCQDCAWPGQRAYAEKPKPKRQYVEGDYRILLEDGHISYHKMYLEEGTTFDQAKRWVEVMSIGTIKNHLWPSRLEVFTSGEWTLV